MRREIPRYTLLQIVGGPKAEHEFPLFDVDIDGETKRAVGLFTTRELAARFAAAQAERQFQVVLLEDEHLYDWLDDCVQSGGGTHLVVNPGQSPRFLVVFEINAVLHALESAGPDAARVQCECITVMA